MLLSFSVDYMRSYVEAGIKQANGGRVRDERIKRQTIRGLGPVAERVLRQCDPVSHRHPGTLHLWWKSRTPDRAHLGDVTGFRAYPLEIEHLRATAPLFELRGPGKSKLMWDGTKSTSGFEEFALADGFHNGEDFVNFFVPRAGAVFRGIIYKW